MAETVRTDVVISAIDKASGPLKRISGGFNLLSKQGLMAGAMFAGVTLGVQAAMQGFQQLQQWLGESVKKFRAFQRSMTEVRTMLTEMESSLLPAMTEEIVQMSIAFGKSATDLSRGLYQVLSAGIDVSKSMIVLRESAKLATVSLTGVETSVDAVTTVLNAYGKSAEESIQVSNIMWKTIELGKLRMSDLASALGFVVPIAAQAGISFEEISAALATLTKQGIRSGLATRGLRQLINQLIAPSEDARGAMVDMGIAYDDLSIEAVGLKGTMDKITDATGGQISEIIRLVPNVRALSAALALGAQDGAIFKSTLDEINDSFGALNTKFNIVTKDAQFFKDRITAINDETDRMIGEKVEPQTKAWEEFFSVLRLAAVPTDDPGWGAYYKNPYKEIQKAAEEYIDKGLDTESVEAYASVFNELSSYISDQAQLVVKLTARMALYNREITAMKEAKDIATQVHDYSEALRYIPLALKDAIYTSKIYDATIDGITYHVQALVDSIRIQREELERLDAVQRQYNMSTSRNSIEIMKIQLAASGRRGRLNRGQKNQMKELQRANDQLRINTMQNQLAISEAQEELRPEEKQLERVKTSYAEQIHIITDSYNRDQEAMQISIDYKQLLIDDYTGYIADANQNVLDGQKVFYDEWLKLDLEFRAELIKQNPQLEIAARNIVLAQDPMQRFAGTTPFEKMLSDLGLPLPSHQHGTPYVSRTGLALLHQGEAVIPADKNRTGATSVRIAPITINVNNNMTTTQLVQSIQNGISSGLVSGLTTVYG